MKNHPERSAPSRPIHSLLEPSRTFQNLPEPYNPFQDLIGQLSPQERLLPLQPETASLKKNAHPHIVPTQPIPNPSLTLPPLPPHPPPFRTSSRPPARCPYPPAWPTAPARGGQPPAPFSPLGCAQPPPPPAPVAVWRTPGRGSAWTCQLARRSPPATGRATAGGGVDGDGRRGGEQGYGFECGQGR